MKEMRNNIKYWREKRGLSRAEFALNLGLKSLGTVSMWENGKRSPSSRRLIEIAILLRCTIDDLFKNIEEGEYEKA
jgi:transcriptional regulator with XRE-family HTH domain